jgi:hypothetical protein
MNSLKYGPGYLIPDYFNILYIPSIKCTGREGGPTVRQDMNKARETREIGYYRNGSKGSRGRHWKERIVGWEEGKVSL